MDVKKFLNIHKSFIILIVILFVTEFVFALFSITASRNSEWAALERNAENIKMHCKHDKDHAASGGISQQGRSINWELSSKNELKLTSDQLDELQRAKRLKFINGHTYELFLKLKGSKKYLHVSTQNYNSSQTMNRINVIITILNLILTFGLIIHHLIKNKEKTP
ncbi:hypothetical protein [Ligilactobacillus ruminis]|uniref:hypothetical protein n=1 Tax=Ligilactobacillus ruminis TaxID=1623 RepID=UPI001C021271|nr:hypothetical protein [Ligilactobacillus ruminis]MBT9627407.1 hypothetical protein [Ligilactobacillus ruminis]